MVRSCRSSEARNSTPRGECAEPERSRQRGNRMKQIRYVQSLLSAYKIEQESIRPLVPAVETFDEAHARYQSKLARSARIHYKNFSYTSLYWPKIRIRLTFVKISRVRDCSPKQSAASPSPLPNYSIHLIAGRREGRQRSRRTGAKPSTVDNAFATILFLTRVQTLDVVHYFIKILGSGDKFVFKFHRKYICRFRYFNDSIIDAVSIK